MTDTTMPNLNLLVSALKPGVWVEADFHDTLLFCEFTVRAPLYLDEKFGNLMCGPHVVRHKDGGAAAFLTGIRVVAPPIPPEPSVGSIAVFLDAVNDEKFLVPVERLFEGWCHSDTTGEPMTWESLCADYGNPVGVVNFNTLVGGSE